MDYYNDTLQKLRDKHTPLKTKVVAVHAEAPWYTEEVRYAKQDKRRAERRWRKTKLVVHRDIYNEKRLYANCLVDKAKRDYYYSKVTDERAQRQEGLVWHCANPDV